MKVGLEYFSLDTVLDTKIDLIEAEFGIKGFAVIVKLWLRIYGEFGYYCEWNDEIALLFSQKIGVGSNTVSEIVSASIRRGIFDKDLYEKYSVLTSNGIQKRYLKGAKRRVQVEIKENYLLLSAPEIKEIIGKSKVSVNIIAKNVNGNEQSKVKESKVKYRIVNDIYMETKTLEEEIDDFLLKEALNAN